MYTQWGFGSSVVGFEADRGFESAAVGFEDELGAIQPLTTESTVAVPARNARRSVEGIQTGRLSSLSVKPSYECYIGSRTGYSIGSTREAHHDWPTEIQPIGLQTRFPVVSTS
ncbi:hypothetical protein [Halobacterium yunchengense]|uniref:hypothetical protein n=1 Tax=Halobacterium yunchengense TaxID=3108497 RepID=UPI003008277A